MTDNNEVPGAASRKPIPDPPDIPAGSEAKEIPQQETGIPDNINEEDITAAGTTPATTPQPAAMEVHHHAHHHGGKRSWKSYIGEFLMLFLAVFCSFIAEWQLEHSIEHSREKQFITSLVQDIKTDEENIEKLNVPYTKILSHLDTLKELLTSSDVLTNSYPAYYHWIRAFGFPDFVPNDGTTRQLLSSGGLRLIGKIQVVDSIMAYQQAIEHVRIFQQNLNTRLSYGSKQYELFDAMALRSGNMQTKIPLLTNDKRLLSWAYGEEEEWRNAILWLRVTTTAVKARGEGLRKAIEEQYEIN